MYYRKGDKSFTLVDVTKLPEFMKHNKLMHSWYTKGYINKDAATAKVNDVTVKGNFAASLDFTLKPGGEIGFSKSPQAMRLCRAAYGSGIYRHSAKRPKIRKER